MCREDTDTNREEAATNEEEEEKEEELTGTNEEKEKEEEETGTNEELAFLNSGKKHEIMRSCLSNLVLKYVK